MRARIKHLLGHSQKRAILWCEGKKFTDDLGCAEVTIMKWKESKLSCHHNYDNGK